MAKAIASGHKTQTRRLVKSGISPYSIGMILWVRETWRVDEHGNYFYLADNPQHRESVSWKPSIHMPKVACRIKLCITDLRTEKLSQISELDAIREGIRMKPNNIFDKQAINKYSVSVYNPAFNLNSKTAVGVFKMLWGTIHGDDSWDRDPDVWVIEFKVLKSF